MPNLKSIIITIIISLLIAVGIFYFIQQGRGNPPLSQALQSIKSSPTPTPTATPTPINETTNLEGEIDQVKPSDYSALYENLKNELNNF